ncbi:MAG: hypothetical protein IJH61_08395 [Eubacteriaceae bacterium]|nr:hypothetical protein [Eubacteriaceae bacterium]
MAERRFISKSIFTHPDFYKLSAMAVKLYSYLVLFADDDGFIGDAKAIQKSCGCNATALRQLIDARFLIQFDNGVSVIRHWYQMNKVPKKKYTETLYTDEKAMLVQNKAGIYNPAESGENTDNTLQRNSAKRSPSTGQDILGQASLHSLCAEERKTADGANVSGEKNPFGYSEEFEEIWRMYPKKRDKYKAYRAYQKVMSEGADIDAIKAGIRRYNEHIEKKDLDEKYLKYGASFFNRRAWEDDYTIDTEHDGREKLSIYDLVSMQVADSPDDQMIDDDDDLPF